MSKGVNIPIAADATGVVSASKKIDGALDDVIDSLDDVTDAGKDTERSVEKSFDQIGKAAKDAGTDIDGQFSKEVKSAGNEADRLERSFKESFDSVKKESKSAGDDIGSHVKKGTQEAEEGVETFKENAASNAKEIGASFSDVQSVIGGIQGLAAEALEGFGPAGLAAGVAGAAGIGLITSALQSADAKAQELHDEAVDLASALRDAGDDGSQVADVLGQKFEDFGSKVALGGSAFSRWFNATDSKTNLDLFVKLLDEGVINAQDLDRAFKSSSAADRIAGLQQIMKTARKTADELNSSTRGLTPAQEDLYVASFKVSENLKDQIAVEQQADALNQALAKSQGQTTAQYEASQQAIEKHTQALQDEGSAAAATADASDIYQTALDDATTAAQQWAQDQADATKDTSDSWQDFATDVTVTLDDVLKEQSARVAKEKAFQQNLALLGARGYGALADSLRSGGPAANGAMTDLLAHGSDTQVQQYASNAGYLTGQNLAKGAATGVTSQTPTVQQSVNTMVSQITVPQINVPVGVDLSKAKTALKQFTDGSYQLFVGGIPVGRKYE